MAASGQRVTKARVDLALALIRDGRTKADAAHAIECAYATLHRILTKEYPEEYEQAKQVGLGARADYWRELVRQHAEDGNSKALDLGAKAYVPEMKDNSGGAVGGAVVVIKIESAFQPETVDVEAAEVQELDADDSRALPRHSETA